MQADQRNDVVADLINVYTSSTAGAEEAAERSRDAHLPMMERVAYRHRAFQLQELADQALRMINELTADAAA